MARRKTTAAELNFEKPATEVITTELHAELEHDFLAYAYMTLEDRAIPDARDGLKPVQRRILYSMQEAGNTANKPVVKSARIVGNTMGVYHPHGDSAIYDAMVRMAQDFSMGVTLIDGKGNFGDRPGSGAASSRYTEARMSHAAAYMTEELKEKAVDFKPNYDESTEEPVVLPNQFPNLLVNGVSGIAVGYATSIAPHNPGEVIEAARWLLTHPNATLDKLMEFVPGPDFPTGCQIIIGDGAREAYETGQGKVTIRSPYTIEPKGRGKHSIEFYELPYSVNVDKILDEIRGAIKNDKIQGIADVKDLTDGRNGIRFVVETKAGVKPEAVVHALYKVSQLETNFSFNSNALVDKVPVLMGLKDMLQVFLDHRIETVTRRTQHRKQKRADRLHLVEGLLKALLDVDTVIKIVRSSPNAQEAQVKLIKKFKVDEVQADYILSLQLRRLTKFDQHELDNEAKTLKQEIAELDELLSDDKKMKALISKELADVKKAIHVDRRSVIIDGKEAAKLEEVAEAHAAALGAEVAEESCMVYLTHRGGVFRSTEETRKAYLSVAGTNTKSQVVLITNKGNAVRVPVIYFNEKETRVSSYLSLSKDERVIAVVPTGGMPDGKKGGIAMGTRKGVVKITAPQFPVKAEEFSVINLDADDVILSARWVEDVDLYDFVFIKNSSNLLSFPASKVRPQGLSGGGMAGVKLLEGERVLSFNVIARGEQETAQVITLTDAGHGKASPYALFPQKGRATGGVRSQAFLKSDKELVFAEVIPSIFLFDSMGRRIHLPESNLKRDASGKPVKEDFAALRS